MATKESAGPTVKALRISGEGSCPQVEQHDDYDVVIDDNTERDGILQLTVEPSGGGLGRPYSYATTDGDMVEGHKDVTIMMGSVMGSEGEHGEHFQQIPVYVAPSYTADKFRDQVDDSVSSHISTEGYSAKNLVFDPSDQFYNDENGLTEPTSVGSEETLGMKEDGMEGSAVVYESTAADNELLLSNLDMNDRHAETSLGDTEEDGHHEDGNETLDLDYVDVAPRQLVTTALDDFIPVEASLKRLPSDYAESSAPIIRCKTQESSLDSVEEINIGLHNTIWRWKLNTQIEFNVNSCSFPPSVDMFHAVKALKLAAQEWNKGLCGVRFELVANGKPAVFQLTYRAASDGSTLARSFIPRYPETTEELQKLFVYPLSFTKQHCPNMANIFYHELGHILGLRHEFAPRREASIRSVQWGPSNTHSVMNYYSDWSLCRIHVHDYASVREFYSFKGKEYRGFKINDLVPNRFSPELPLLKRTW